MFTAIIMATALSGSALVEEADRRNLAYTQCTFAQARAAREAGLSTDAMLAQVDRVCHAERAAMREALVAVLVQRGQSRAQAQAEWDRLQSSTREALRRAYSV